MMNRGHWLCLFLALLTTFTGIAQQYLAIGSYNWDAEKTGIYIYHLDTVTGGLSFKTSVTGVLNPAYLTTCGNMIYACTEAQTKGKGSVSSFMYNEQANTITPVSMRPSGGENPVHISLHRSGQWLVNANYTDGSVSVYRTGKDGTISDTVQVIRFTGSSVNRERQRSPHIHAAAFAPQHDHIILPDLGTDLLRTFMFDTAAAQPLQAIGNVPCAPGSGPRHFTFSPNGKYSYCIEELSGTIGVYTYTNDTLAPVQRITTHKSKRTRGYHSADIHISPDGRYLYASNRGKEDNIAIFSIDPHNGKLETIGYQRTLGIHPRNFAIHPSGKYLLVANQETGNLLVFRRDAKTGLLQATGATIEVPGASCIQFMDAAGN